MFGLGLLFSPLALFQAQSTRLPHLGGVDVHFSGMADCFTQIVKHKGIFSLWNGITANMIKVQLPKKIKEVICSPPIVKSWYK